MVVRLQLPPKSARSHTFVYLLASALLASTALLTPCAESRQRPVSSNMATGSAGKAITVWKVGSPFGGDTPDTTIPRES